jgi:threonine/homoserine/homoserine lactone efflux protein
MTFLQAAAFQWVNPKAWAMALTAISVYAPDQTLWAILLVAALFGAVNLPSVSSWTLLGQQMARVLTNPRRLMLFNWAMAALLVASLYPVIWPA